MSSKPINYGSNSGDWFGRPLGLRKRLADPCGALANRASNTGTSGQPPIPGALGGSPDNLSEVGLPELGVVQTPVPDDLTPRTRMHQGGPAEPTLVRSRTLRDRLRGITLGDRLSDFGAAFFRASQSRETPKRAPKKSKLARPHTKAPNGHLLHDDTARGLPRDVDADVADADGHHEVPRVRRMCSASFRNSALMRPKHLKLWRCN